MKKPSVAIIGAGISGLTLAHKLKDHATITIFEKARGVSGRMSTRRAEPYFFDHGAQYFTVCSQGFKTFLAPLFEQGIIQEWAPQYIQLDRNGNPTNTEDNKKKHPWYVGNPGMNAICKYLAKDLAPHIHLQTRVENISQNNRWTLTDDQGNTLGDYDWVISTAPAQQSKELLPSNFSHHNDITNTKMLACCSLMLGFEKPLYLPFEAAHVQNADISWISKNSCKPGRAPQYSLLIQSSHQWAQDHCDDDKDIILSTLINSASKILKQDLSEADHQTIHLWRYAFAQQKETPSPLIDTNSKLAACGDWCTGGRIESAFESASKLANKIIESLK
jgi:renalase